MLVGCGENGDAGGGHVHQYTEKLTYVPGAEIKAPTCTSGGEYYYACTCGKTGTETYKTAPRPHNFTRTIADAEHLAKAATCTSAAKYYYTCSDCDAISNEFTFSSGKKLEHSYTDNVCTNGCGEELNKYTLSDGGDYYTLTLFREKIAVATLPSQYKGLPVRAIAPHAFAGSEVKEVILPDSITEISENAFYANGALEKINLSGVTAIGEYAFYACTALGEVELNPSVTLGDYCFANTGIQQITIPETVSEIGIGAFSLCSALTEIYYNAANANDITYPNSVFYSVNDTAKDITLYIGKSVERIPASFFCNSKVAEIVIHEECNSLTIGNHAFYKASLPTALVLERVATVGARAFYGTGITKLTLAGHIDLVEREAFADCNSLTEVTIMKNRGRFSDHIFTLCEGLNTVYYNHEGEETLSLALSSSGEALKLIIGSNVKTIPEGFISGGVSYLEFASGASDVTISDNAFVSNIRGELDLSCVKSIGNCAFAYSQAEISKLILPEGLESIGFSAFNKVNELVYLAKRCADVALDTGSKRSAFIEIGSVSFGAEVEYIPANIFFDTKIGTVSFLGENPLIEEIGDYAFYSATITSLSLPASILEIGDYAFCYTNANNSSLNLSEIKDFGIYSFAYFVGNITLSGSNAIYFEEGAFKSTSISGELDLSNATVIAADCFNNCTGITKLILGEDLHVMGERAFQDCVGLTEVVFNAVSTLENTDLDSSFFDYTKPTQGFKLTIGEMVSLIPNCLFKSSAVKEIVFLGESSCKIIGDYAFAYTDKLELCDVVLPDSIESVGSYAFFLSKLRSITFGSNIKYIGANALYSMGILEGDVVRDYGYLSEVYFTHQTELKAYSYNSESGVATDTGESVTFAANDEENANEYAKLFYRENILYRYADYEEQ